MNRRERVMASLRHREPDRVPLDLGSTDTTGISGIAYNRLKKYLGLDGTHTRILPVQQIALVESGVLQAAGGDLMMVNAEPAAWRPDRLPDGSPCEVPLRWNPIRQPDGSQTVFDAGGAGRYHMASGGCYFEPINPPLANAATPREIGKGMKFIVDFDRHDFLDEPLESMAARARGLYETTDYALVGHFAVHVYAGGQRLRGFEQFMVDLLSEPAMAECIMERLVDAYIARFDRLFAAVGPFIQVINVADDLGTQAGLQLSPELYRKAVKPHHERLFRHIKRHAGLFLFLHSDGSIRDLIPDFIEMGVDILNPVQFTCERMDLKELKTEFGRDIAFWGGGCDTRDILPGATPGAVKDHVKACLDIMAPGGGFVFNQLHNIQPEVPPANIMAMYEAVHEWGSKS